ncbi:hypothetical protein BDV25DRAFT_158809 [Aspergillus avenaceus]|uniref:Uncharacterized protein n=1 Tax=Aspergillus avenaceus TaxID=36643 RepID=A0A5N6TPI3_ASPAV|nr:hypothetical protein BDV25DRAFT_158809 [Aspergillus avenaceus]
MPMKPSRPQDSSVLGESWVVTSTSSDKTEPNKEGQSAESPNAKSPKLDDIDGYNERSNGSESMTTSASSISGPELIMPSICEAPISEASWFAPDLRSKEMPARSLRRRNKSSHEDVVQGEKQDSETPTKSLSEKKAAEASNNQPASPRPSPLETVIRTTINVLLVGAILHILIIPEVVQQYQTLCSIGPLSTLYPASCIPPYPQPQATHHQPTRYDTVILSQSRLESLFNTTLHEMTPTSNALKQGESKLRDLEFEMKKAYPGTKHELDLEFDGCWQATREASSKFDSLKADIRSAIDNLVVTGSSDAQSMAKDARASTQISWREQYLEQLTTRMQSKADSLSNDLDTLDDHLESIGAILAREVKQSTVTPESSSGPDLQGSGFGGLVDKLPSFLRPVKPDDADRPDQTLFNLFHEAANQHRSLVNTVRHLSNDLQALQKK